MKISDKSRNFKKRSRNFYLLMTHRMNATMQVSKVSSAKKVNKNISVVSSVVIKKVNKKKNIIKDDKILVGDFLGLHNNSMMAFRGTTMRFTM